MKCICRAPGCGKLIDAPGHCDRHKKQVRKEQDQRRGTAAERGYDSRWAKARVFYLRKHPFCVYCLRQAGITAVDTQGIAAACMKRQMHPPLANVVDHIIPHKLKEAIDSQDEVRIEKARALFWDSAGNWQSLCKPCHDSVKQSEERRAGHYI